MANRKGRRRTARIKFRQSATLVHKVDKTRVTRPDTARYKRVQGRPPADVGVTFKVKIRRR